MSVSTQFKLATKIDLVNYEQPYWDAYLEHLYFTDPVNYYAKGEAWRCEVELLEKPDYEELGWG